MAEPRCALCGAPAVTSARLGGGGSVPACAGCAAPSPRNPKNKYGAVPTVVDGRRFASKKEAKRYGELKLLQQAGKISDLVCQVRFPLTVNEQLVCTYVADFTYFEDGHLIVEDAKGKRTGEYKLKAKLMKACRGIVIRET